MTMMEQVLVFATVIAPSVTALTALVKRAFPVNVNYVPLISFVLGLLLGAAGYIFTELPLDARLWAGGMSGLSGVGLYEVFVQRKGTTKQE